MARRVVMHIGAPKSGTTFLQSVLWANRESLREQGVLIPGERLDDYNRAARAIRLKHQADGPATGTWRALLAEAAAWPETALMSAEWFCLAPKAQVRRTLAQLQPAEVHVVYTARALVPLVAAAWQEAVKLGDPRTLDEFQDSMEQGRDRWSWWTLDPVHVFQRWERAGVPPERMHVVTVPQQRSSPDTLLVRFGEAVGADLSGMTLSRARPNESLSVEAAEVMRRVGPQVDELVDFDSQHWHDRYRWLRRYLAQTVLAEHAGHRIALRRRQVRALNQRSDAVVELVRSRGYHVHGDLADLTGAANPPGAKRPDRIRAEELLAVAVPAMARLVHDVREQTLAQETEDNP